MRIHVWAPAFAGFGGGITAFSAALAAGLDDLGHDLRLFGKSDSTGVWAGLPLAGGASRRIIPRTAAFGFAALGAVARHRPDRVISTHVNFGPVALIAKRLTGTPFTLVAHGIDINRALPRTTLAAIRAADRIIAVSAWTRARVISLGGVDPANVAVLPNTVSPARFGVGTRPAYLADRYAIGTEEKVVLAVARLDADEGYKGYDRTIEALPAVINACGPTRFILAGAGDDRARVVKLSHDLGVHHAVTFAGFVPDFELADHYRLADAFAMPSTGEGFGIVFLEAMACGTPVLGGNRDGSMDALDGGRLGKLVNPTDVGAIADGLISLLARQGPAFWFDRQALSEATMSAFGPGAFREKLNRALCF